MVKFTKWIGLAACLLLILSCFLPWTYHEDLQKSFNGFFSEDNMYGKPGKVLVTVALLAFIAFLVNKVWVKRTIIMITAISFAYALKTFLVFAACYRGYCPEKKTGLWLMLGASAMILIMSVFPDLTIRKKSMDSGPVESTEPNNEIQTGEINPEG